MILLQETNYHKRKLRLIAKTGTDSGFVRRKGLCTATAPLTTLSYRNSLIKIPYLMYPNEMLS